MSKVYTLHTGNFNTNYPNIISSSLQLNSLTGPITGSLTGSLRGTLIGTASWAVTSSLSISSSYVIPTGLPAGTISSSLQLNSLTAPITGSLTGSLRGTLIGTSSWSTNAVTATQVGAALTAGTGLTSAGTFTGATARTFAIDTTYTDGRYAVGNKTSGYNISGSGNWFTVASRSGSLGRGIAEVYVYSGGGDVAPNVLKVLWNVDWGSTAQIRIIGFSGTIPVSNIRTTYTGSTQTTYLEIQSATAANATVYSQVVNYGSSGVTASAVIGPSINDPVLTSIPIAYHYDGVMFVSASGNVGIGTTAPLNKLQIQGNVSASSYTSSVANGVGYLGTSSRAVSSSRADSTEKVDVLVGGSTTGLGSYSGSFSGSFSGMSADVVTTYTSGSDNRVVTSTGTAGINGESTLTYDGTTLYVSGALGVGTSTPTTIGLIRATNDIQAYYSSDIRLKENPMVITDALVKLDKIHGYEFDWIPAKGIHENQGHDIGVIAQEIIEVLPEIVTIRDNGYMAVKYEKIIPLLIQGMKEQQIQLKEQQIQIDDLKQQINGLKQQKRIV